MARRNRRQQRQNLATAIVQAFATILPSVMVQIQQQFANQQSPSTSSSQNTNNHAHTEIPTNGEKTEESTETQTKTFTAETSKSASRKTTKKRKGKPYPYAIPAIPLQQIPSVIPLNQKSYTGSAPFCNICTYHHYPTSECRYCTYCSKFGHTLDYCRKAKRNAAQFNQAGDSYNSSGDRY